jgi:hypothetical protein
MVEKKPQPKTAEQTTEKPDPIHVIFERYETLAEKLEQPLENMDRVRVLIYTAMLHEPSTFQDMAQKLEIPEELSWTYVKEAYRDETLRNIALTLEIPPLTNGEKTKKNEHRSHKKRENEKKQKKEENLPSEEIAVFPLDLQTFDLTLHASSILTEREFVIAQLVEDRITTQQISKKIGLSPGRVGFYLSKARTKIEAAVLQPSGIIRVSRYKDPSLASAVARNRIPVRKILCRNYTTEKIAQQFITTKKRPGEKRVEEKGYHLLTEALSGAERHAFYTRYRSLVEKHGNRVYIHDSVLKAYKDGTIDSLLHPPALQDDQEFIHKIAQDRKEYMRLHKAVKSGMIPGSFIHNKWAVNRSDVETYRREREEGIEEMVQLSHIATDPREYRRLFDAYKRGDITARKRKNRLFVNPEEIDAYRKRK